MSKSLKKLIDINRLREFKNKLVGTGSAYVQTGAVDQTVAGIKTFSKPIAGSVTGSSGSCTGNAATATKAVSADSATNASHATSADKATKAEQDGNGNNIVASYVAAGSEGSTTDDIGAFMAARPSFIKSFTYNNVWTDAISVRHRNGGGDGNKYGTYIRSSNMTGVSNLLWNHQSAGKWQGERTLVDSANLAGFINITDSTGDNTGEAVSVSGSAAVTLKLPATIKANVTGNCSGSSGSCTGNAATATKATGNANGKELTNTIIKGLSISGKTITYTQIDGSTGTLTTQDTNTDTLMTQNVSTTNSTYPILLCPTANATSNQGAKTGIFAKSVKVNPSTNVISASGFSGPLTGNVTGNCSGSSGSCTGNAATATKLAAKRTIALSGAATGTATDFDGSGNITIPVTALASSAIRAQWYAAFPDGAEAHNAMWGGRDITAAFNNGTVSANIANGTFKDIFPGDYITKQVTISGKKYTVNWVIADCDYWWHKGDQNNGMETHHVAIVPWDIIFFAQMNSTNTTEGGYAGSEMYKNIIPACAAGIVNAFGSGHILTFRDAISNSVDTSHVSSGLPQATGTPGWWGEWVSVQCNLMSEKMVYGAPICSAGAMDNTMATRQMSAFRLSERLINYSRQNWWLRDVGSSATFANVLGSGDAHLGAASGSSGVRPFALLK